MKKLIILMLGICFCTNIFADSIFSSKGFVEENFGVDNYSTGMGQTGISSIFRKNFSICNPALNANIKATNYLAKLKFGATYYNSNSDKFEQRTSNFPYVKIIIPLGEDSFLGTSFFEKYYFGLDNKYEFFDEDIGNVTASNTHKGSLNQFGLSLTRKFKKIFAGIAVNFNFGNKINDYEVDFEESDLVDHQENYEHLISGTNFILGFAIPLSKFSIGAFYESELKLNSNDEYTIEYEDNSSLDYIFTGETDFILPSQFGFGLGLKINEDFYAETNYRRSLWDKSLNSLMNSRNTNYVSLGIAFDPSEEIKWKIPLRIGGYFKQLPCKSNNNYIDEKALTLGFDIPLKFANRGNISFAFIYGKRGNLSKNSYNDEFFRISIGISSIDKWKNPQNIKRDKEIPKADPEYEEIWD